MCSYQNLIEVNLFSLKTKRRTKMHGKDDVTNFIIPMYSSSPSYFLTKEEEKISRWNFGKR